MVFAASLGFLKMVVLSITLDAADYGFYIAIFGLSTLSSVIISFGLLERTTKLYPRLWVDNMRDDILSDAKHTALKLLIRFFLVALAGLLIAYVGVLSIALSEVIFFSLLGLGSVWLALIASLYRATGSSRTLGYFTFWRSGIALLFALVGGLYWGWTGALAGEILAAVCTCIYAGIVLKRLFGNSLDEEPLMKSSTTVLKRNSGHHGLYVANTVTASTLMADKVMVGNALGAVAAGSYGVVMLISQMFQVFVNIVSQHVGPRIIKIVYLRREEASIIGAIGLQLIFCSLLAVITVAVVLFGKDFQALEPFFTKFNISDASVVLAGVAAAGQIYSLISFHLVARNGERFVLFASLFSGGLFFLLFFVASYQALALEYFVAAAAVTRWVQASILMWGLIRLKGRV